MIGKNSPGKEARADLYQRASAEAFAALQLAAMDAIDTARHVAQAIALLEDSKTISDDEQTAIIAVLQSIPAARDGAADQPKAEEKV